jgi:flagellar biosynthesis protein FlhG
VKSEREANAVFEKIKKVANANIGTKLDLQLYGKINADVKVSSSVKQRALFTALHPNSQVYKDIEGIVKLLMSKLERNMLVSSNESGLSGLFKRLIEHF